MCVDGNGECVIVALWVVASEERDTISSLMDCFKMYNVTSNVKVIMADMDMVEREVMSEKIPDAALQICLFHTLRTFRREVTAEKLGLKADQRLVVLEIFEKLTYSSSEEEYDSHYQTLKAVNIASVLDYFDKNWHGIHRQWVEGLKKQSVALLNSTTNGVECINQKLKGIITKQSGIVTFFQDLKTVLAVLETKRNDRALHMIQKSSAQSQTCTEQLYAQLTTPYAMGHISTQLLAAERCDVIPDSTTRSTCQCGYPSGMGLPCRHIFRFRLNNGDDLFDASLVSERWSKDYFIAGQSWDMESDSESGAVRVVSNQASAGPLSQQGKYKKASIISQRIASLVADATDSHFDQLITRLLDFENSLTVDQPAPTPQAVHQPASTLLIVHEPTSTPQAMHQVAPAPQALRQLAPAPQALRQLAPAPQAVRQLEPTPEVVHEPLLYEWEELKSMHFYIFVLLHLTIPETWSHKNSRSLLAKILLASTKYI